MGNKNKAKGTSYEVLVRDHFIANGFLNTHRTALAGGLDAGDLHGIQRPDTQRKVCVQCKNDKSFNISGWLNDTVEQAKRLNDAVPALVVKRKGKGEKALGESYVVMRLDDLIELLKEANYS